jgi:hypothetical protein
VRSFGIRTWCRSRRPATESVRLSREKCEESSSAPSCHECRIWSPRFKNWALGPADRSRAVQMTSPESKSGPRCLRLGSGRIGDHSRPWAMQYSCHSTTISESLTSRRRLCRGDLRSQQPTACVGSQWHCVGPACLVIGKLPAKAGRSASRRRSCNVEQNGCRTHEAGAEWGLQSANGWVDLVVSWALVYIIVLMRHCFSAPFPVRFRAQLPAQHHLYLFTSDLPSDLLKGHLVKGHLTGDLSCCISH